MDYTIIYNSICRHTSATKLGILTQHAVLSPLIRSLLIDVTINNSTLRKEPRSTSICYYMIAQIYATNPTLPHGTVCVYAAM